MKWKKVLMGWELELWHGRILVSVIQLPNGRWRSILHLGWELVCGGEAQNVTEAMKLAIGWLRDLDNEIREVAAGREAVGP